jgi:hypothetical protein
MKLKIMHKNFLTVTNTATAQFSRIHFKMKAQMKNNAVSEPPLTSFAQHSNYITVGWYRNGLPLEMAKQ